MTMKYKVTDAGDIRKYYFQVPNIIDDMGLDVYNFRLYCHLKRVAGDEGACWQSTETLAAACKMGVATVVKCKKELVAAGLIEIATKRGQHGGRDLHLITITDIWAKNVSTSWGEVASSRGEVASAVGRSKEELVNKNPYIAPDGAAGVSCEGYEVQDEESTQEMSVDLPVLAAPMPMKRALDYYPGDVREFVAVVADCLHIEPPLKAGPKGRKTPDGFWIKGARELAEACGEARTAAVTAVYKAWSTERARLGREPYALTSPRSFVNVARVQAGQLIEHAAVETVVDGDGGFYA